MDWELSSGHWQRGRELARGDSSSWSTLCISSLCSGREVALVKAMKATPGGGHGLASRAGIDLFTNTSQRSASASTTARPRSTRPSGKATVDDIVSELAADAGDGAALEVAWWRTCPDRALPVLSPSSCC